MDVDVKVLGMKQGEKEKQFEFREEGRVTALFDIQI